MAKLLIIDDSILTRNMLRKFLEQQGCNEHQGFLFSPAVPSDRFEELLVAGGREADGEERP